MAISRARHHGKNDVDSLLSRWLAERQDLLRGLCGLGAALRADHTPALRTRLDHFCEVLVDYMSAGHFEVYIKLLEQGEREGSAPTRAQALYRLIAPTTAAALDFNDRYFRGASGPRLREDLSRLGQLLASRFDWEDALIAQLHGPRRAVA
jgi:regulator of sigma D